MSIWIWIYSRHLVCISWKCWKFLIASCSFLSSSISIIFCMPVVGFAMLIFMLGEGLDFFQRRSGWWKTGLRLPVASSDLRKKKKGGRVAQLGAATWPCRDDNDILWGLATKSLSWGGKDWKGGSWSRVHLSSWNVPDLKHSTAGTCNSPADFFALRSVCETPGVKPRPGETGEATILCPNRTLMIPKLSETIRNSQTQLQSCLRKDPKHPKTYPNDEECIRINKNATEIWHLCNWLLHIAVALLRTLRLVIG